MSDEDVFELSRFKHAQDSVMGNVYRELEAGKKTSHWMWYVFPQFFGLGHSEMANHYAIKSLDEARAYFSHPVLGERLVKCLRLVMSTEGRSSRDIFGYPDYLKFHSSLTLFLQATGEQMFQKVLDRFYNGQSDEQTLNLLKKGGDLLSTQP